MLLFAEQQSEKPDEARLKKSNALIQNTAENRSSEVCQEMDEKALPDRNEAAENHEKCQNSAKNNETRTNEPWSEEENCEKANAESISQEFVTLDALESTKAAVAQFAAAALSKGANENSIKDMTMLQSALFTLQHQQVFQMQLIEQLQYQLAKNNVRSDKKRTKLKKEEIIELDQANAAEEDALTRVKW